MRLTGSAAISAVFFPACFFFFAGFNFRSSGSGASRSQTASASLKNTIVPSTSIKRICSGSDIFSLDLPKRSFLKRTSCSIISCILSFNACVCRFRSSICPCIPRKSWISSSLSSLFSCSSVYLNVITGTPVFILVLIITDFLYYRQFRPSAASA